MKQFNIIALVALFLVAGCGITRQTPEEKQAEQQRTAQLVREKLNARSYRIDVDYMYPLRGSSKAVTSYSVTVSRDSLDSHLPYIGVATNIPYGGGNGLNFKDRISGYSETVDGDRHTIVITVRNPEDTYVYTLDIFDNTNAGISVHCRNREDIRYHGTLRLDDVK